MTRFLTLVATGAMIGMTTIACTSPARQDREDYQYQLDTSRNPACAGGFRPGNARSCSY
ncbi:hypothetical protein GA0061105_101597 [Rhizobium aethiopicum]|uniref:Lipoprotein n=1 Tax=Rhizobium aethiopicum TaxID=1138170 RepID=A0A1C3XXI2_9HYPH|nr:hypothetical protein [Rhizobium aethiopicum]SCB56764.1 hypothetical protein GA0061105_101597 [Rhizobium aethiopicum]